MKTLWIILFLVIAITSVFAQPSGEKNKELSISGSYQNYSSGGSSESTGAFLISPRLGFFVAEGFEIEPEFVAMFASGSDPAYMINGNISYNFITAGKAVPFLLVGYGLANTVPFFNVPFLKTDFKVDVLNVGGGVKAFLREDVAIRFEYRYQKFSGQGETSVYSFYSYTEKIDTRIHTVQFGLSVLL